MAYDKIVDSAKLDADLTMVADAIRARAGTTEPLAFPEGMKEAVEGIPDYMRQRAMGTIVNYYDPVVTKLAPGCFARCHTIESIDCPEVTILENNCLEETTAITRVNLPKVYKVGNASFYNSGIKTLYLPKCKEIIYSAFGNSQLTSLVLSFTEQVAHLYSAESFNNSPISAGTGYIYVPRSLVDSYKSHTNWAPLASQFRAIEDYTIDGTATGELDPNKI